MLIFQLITKIENYIALLSSKRITVSSFLLGKYRIKQDKDFPKSLKLHTGVSF